METKPHTLIEKLFELKQKSIVIFRDEQAFNYKYADLAQIQDAIAPALQELRLLIVHKTLDGKVCTVIANVDDETQTVTSEIEIGKINTTREWTDSKGIHTTEVTEQDPQAVGSIITYYRRYNLLQLLDLKTEDNDWASASPRAKNAPQSHETPKEVVWPTEWIDKAKIASLIEKLKTGELVAGSQQSAVALARKYYKVSKENADIIAQEYSKQVWL